MAVTWLSGCGIASQGVALHHLVWNCLPGRGIASLGMAWPHWVWHVLSGCGIVSVRVSMALVGVA